MLYWSILAYLVVCLLLIIGTRRYLKEDLTLGDIIFSPVGPPLFLIAEFCAYLDKVIISFKKE